jgi:hypothetical protein
VAALGPTTPTDCAGSRDSSPGNGWIRGCSASPPSTVDPGGDLASLVAAETAGRVDRFQRYQEWTAPEFRIESGSPLLDVGVDGEALRLPPPLGLPIAAGRATHPDPDERCCVARGGTPASNWLAAVALLRVLTDGPAR